MSNLTTISFENAKLQKKLSHLILRFAIEFRQIGEYKFTYFTGAVPVLISYLDQFSFPRLSKSAKLNNLSGELTAVFVLKNQRLIGLAILNHQNLENCIIECFNIFSGYCNQGVGNLLLNIIKEMATLGNYASLSVVFRTYWKDAVIWEKMLFDQHWESEANLMYYCIITNPRLQQQTRWYKRATDNCPYQFLPANPTNLHILKSDLTDSKWENKIPQSLNPFQLSQILDEQSSFIVKKEETIIGWMLNHQLRADLWQITTVFLLPKYRGAGPAFFAEFLRRHNNRGQFNFMIEPQNKKMFAFAERYFVPAGAKIYQQKKFRIQINSIN